MQPWYTMCTKSFLIFFMLRRNNFVVFVCYLMTLLHLTWLVMIASFEGVLVRSSLESERTTRYTLRIAGESTVVSTGCLPPPQYRFIEAAVFSGFLEMKLWDNLLGVLLETIFVLQSILQLILGQYAYVFSSGIFLVLQCCSIPFVVFQLLCLERNIQYYFMFMVPCIVIYSMK